jgi:membrane protein YdbS with pleckstrin-like domain
MRLLINKDGRSLGPYGLEEARSLVLSGRLSATDWAWPDGATQWVALKDVPGFSSVAPAAASVPTAPAAVAAEEELWSGGPSQVVNLKLYIVWTLVLLGVGSAVTVRSDLWPVLAILAVVALLQIAVRNLRLRSIRYVVTTQRVRVVSGFFSRDIEEVELFRLGTITILSGDERHPRLVLVGIPGAVELREMDVM